MKPFAPIAVVLFALIAPLAASAGPSYTMVYRPEVRTTVLVPSPAEAAATQPSDTEMIARHRALAAAYRMNMSPRGAVSPADHCDRIVAELQKAERARR